MYRTRFILTRRVYLTILCWSVLLISSFYSHAQTAAATDNKLKKLPFEGGLTVGDKVPDLVINNIINYKVPGSKISDFKDKLLILDFMTTNCLSCIRALPRFDSLQKQFGERLQILLVTPEKEDRIKGFLQKNKIGEKINLIWVAEDSLLKKYFPHESISHEVWIYNGIVKAITGAEYVKNENIQTVLNGTKINWPIKNDINDYDYNQRLFLLNRNNIPSSSLPAQSAYSAFTNYMPDLARHSSTDRRIRSDYVFDSATSTERFYMINFTIVDLYLKAFNQPSDFPRNRVVLEARDKNRFFFDPITAYSDVWMRDNTYCYEAVFPASVPDERRKQKIKNDLDFYLGLNGRMEVRKMKCLVLSRTGGSDSLLQAKLKRIVVNGEVQSSNYSIQTFSYLLNEKNNYPVIDVTNYGQTKFLPLTKSDYSDINALSAKLVKYGLQLKEEERELTVLVLAEK